MRRAPEDRPTATITLRLTPALLTVLDRLARGDDRSRSNVMRRLIAEAAKHTEESR